MYVCMYNFKGTNSLIILRRDADCEKPRQRVGETCLLRKTLRAKYGRSYAADDEHCEAVQGEHIKISDILQSQ